MSKEPNNEPLLLHLSAPTSNEMMQANASANVNGVHAAVNSITISHVQPILKVRANSVTTPGYGGFNSKTNPSFDPMVTMSTKVTSLDLDPVTFLGPELSVLSQFGHPVLPRVDLTCPGYYGIPYTTEQASCTRHGSSRFGATLTPL